MSVRRILIEKTVLLLGKWDVTRVNEDVVRLIDIDSREKKGKKIRLQLTTEGLQVARGMFQESQADDFIPISAILNIITGTYGPLNVMCFTRGQTTNYSVIVYTCTNDYDCAEFVDNYRRLRRGVTAEGENFDLRPIDDSNWSVGVSHVTEKPNIVYVQKNRQIPVGKGHIIVSPPKAPSYEQAMTIKRGESVNKGNIQNGNGQTYSDSGIVTNGSVSTEKSRSKPKRSKSFKFFDSLKGKSKRDQSPRRERKSKQEKHSKTSHVDPVGTNSVNAVRPQPPKGHEDMTQAQIRENLQQLNEEVRNISLILKSNPPEDVENMSDVKVAPKQVNGADKRITSTKKQAIYASSDSELRPSSRSRKPSNERRQFITNNVSRTQSSRNGDVEIVTTDHRIPVTYVEKRPVRIAHAAPNEIPFQHYRQRTRAYSNGMDPRSSAAVPLEVQVGPSPTVSSSMTLPRSYRSDGTGTQGMKHSPKVTFNEPTTEGTSKRSSTRSAGKLIHGPRATDTVVKPIDKVYGNQNVYYGHPRTVYVTPAVRQGSGQRHVVQHGREYVLDDRRNGAQELGH